MTVTIAVGTNSYVSVEDATSYFADRLYADAWDDASADDRAKALIMATRVIDRQALKGARKLQATDQALQFPRCYVGTLYQTLYPGQTQPLQIRTIIPAPQPIAYYGWVCETDVPQPVIDATCEEALALLDRGNSRRRRMQLDGVVSFRDLSLSETYATASTGKSIKPKALISDEARQLLAPYLAGSVRIV